MSEDIISLSNIAHWYSGRCVFITGASGFLGKVLIEKLLRSCPGIKKIYVLLRDKRDKLAEERLSSILKEPLFDNLRENKSHSFEKIIIIKGDVTLPNLGINSKDRDVLAQDVSVVFHSAATTKFNDAIKTAFLMNVVGTEEVINLALKMKNLEAFIHISTAFSNCNYKEVEEKLYDSPIQFQKLKQLFEILDDEQLAHLTPKLLKNWPNTYTFTKALAEQKIQEYVQNNRLPAAIIRPAIVTAAWTEPLPGWTDNINGPTGLLVGSGMGIIRSILSIGERKPCIIPVDFVVNLIISVAWHIGNNKILSVPFYNNSVGVLNPIRNRDMQVSFDKNSRMYPFESSIWLPKCVGTPYVVKHRIHSFLTRTCPAYIADFIFTIIGKKLIAVKLIKKMDAMMAAYEYFIYEEWKFHTENIPKLLDNMSHIDKEIFYVDVNAINWKSYLVNYHLGVKKYVLKEKMEDIPKAKMHLKWLKMAYYSSWAILIGFVMILLKYVSNI